MPLHSRIVVACARGLQVARWKRSVLVAVLLECLVELFDFRDDPRIACGDHRAADRGDEEAGQQADDDDDDQELDEGEAAARGWCGRGAGGRWGGSHL